MIAKHNRQNIQPADLNCDQMIMVTKLNVEWTTAHKHAGILTVVDVVYGCNVGVVPDRQVKCDRQAQS